MQKPAKQFIDLLESQQLLAPDILEELRRQVAESKTRLTTELLAKLLVDNGHLTKFQATKLIAEIKEPSASTKNKVDAIVDEDELGLAEEISAKPSVGKNSGKQVAAVFSDDEELVDDIDTEDANVVEVVDDEVIEVVDVEEVVDAIEVDPVASVGGTVAHDAFGSVPKPTTKLVRPPKSKANPYDSFRILGVGILLALSLVAGFFLVNYFWRGNADEQMKRADDAYEQRSYETAAAMYKQFAASFPSNAKASYAIVRSALATLRKDAEGAPDPAIGLNTALQVLPSVASEPGLADQQSDLAGALIALASKFNERADRTETTAERKSLMAEMEKLLALINDPQFVGTNQRNQQAPTLNRIQEDRQRILREINRDEELSVAIAEIDKRLESQDTVGAYDVRKTLINRYPLLEANAELTQRVTRASAIQRSLVKSANLNVKLSKRPAEPDFGKSFLLAHRSGETASKLSGSVVFVKAKGSVYALDAGNGNILWRQFVGREFQSEPIRLGSTSAVDAVICQPEKGQITRLAGKSGESLWFADLGTPIHTPTADGEELFAATLDGTILCQDAGGGQARWSTQLPQPSSVAPGVAPGKPNLYVPGDHSNLYVLSRTDGACQEVLYLGHRAGSIAVPPILLLGQLFVFENINSETCKIRILSTSDRGLELKDAQVPIKMDGNIVLPPQIDGRRLFVQTDLGQIKVLDIEPTVETQKVSEIANVTKNVFEPKQSWLITENNRVWIADSQFTRFNLQVTSGQMKRAWVENPGDQFVSAPQLLGEVIVHCRTQRGTQGVRVEAVEADTRKPLWKTDIGIPVTFVHSTGSGFDAVNSSAMLYALGNVPIRAEADENPGQGGPALLFANPIQTSDQRTVMFNKSRGNQLAIYSSSTPKVRLLTAAFGSAQPSCEPVAIEERVLVGLDSGQLVMIDLTTGAIAGSPYQPSLQAGQKVRWNTPAYLADSRTVIAASDLQKLVRLSVGEDLRVLSEVVLENPLIGPIVPAGNRVCAVQSAKSGDSLLFFDATNLSKVGELQLAGRLLAGPYARPEGVVIQTDAKLMMIGNDAKTIWEIDFAETRLIGSPIEAKGNLLLAALSGELWTISPTNGAVVGSIDVGQALSSQPLLLPAGVLVGSDEGAVLAVEIPSSKPEAR